MVSLSLTSIFLRKVIFQVNSLVIDILHPYFFFSEYDIHILSIYIITLTYPTMICSSTKKVILAKCVEWDSGILFVLKRDETGRIWEYIDPNLSDKHAQTGYPTQPILTWLKDIFVNPTDLEVYKLELIEFKAELAKYERQKKVSRDMRVLIRDTIAVQNAILIQHKDYSWDVLKYWKYGWHLATNHWVSLLSNNIRNCVNDRVYKTSRYG